MKNLLAQFHDLFLPGEANDGIPRLLSPAGISAYFLIALALIITPSYLRISQLASLTAPAIFAKEELVALTNDARTRAGLAPLSVNLKLEHAARAKLEDMFAKQYFSHIGPDAETPWNFIRNEEYVYRAAGENLASDFPRALDAQNAFMASPSHRANILNHTYTEVGIAVAQGTLDGRTTILVAEYFGAPKIASGAPAAGARGAPRPPAGGSRPPSEPPRPASSGTVSVNARAAVRLTPTGTSAPEVLGTATVPAAPGRIARFTNGVRAIYALTPLDVKMKIIAIVLMATLAIALGLLAARTRRIPRLAGMRALLALIVLGYAATLGIPPIPAAHLSPGSESTAEVIQ